VGLQQHLRCCCRKLFAPTKRKEKKKKNKRKERSKEKRNKRIRKEKKTYPPKGG
jgi:hypothetical protein